MNLATQLFPSERQKLLEQFEDKLQTAHHFNRKAVSFQASKSEPIYRWFKYKEGFSSELVRHFLREYTQGPGKLLDPFAGAGTTLFAGKELGWETRGIELLPVGAFAIKARGAFDLLDFGELQRGIDDVRRHIGNWEATGISFQHLKITKDAFPEASENSLNGFLNYCFKLKDDRLQTILKFAGMSVLEESSFTRKDGQYLRWDHRSNRVLSGKPFDKGNIFSFDDALRKKLDQILEDALPMHSLLPLSANPQQEEAGSIELITGSCLKILPEFESDQFDFVITSPPYCNRYDYTRTYALELAYLGLDDNDVGKLRQEMLSCTVENKDKLLQMQSLYQTIEKPASFEQVLSVYEGDAAMSEVNIILEKLKDLDQLNNKNIARMVRNYFLEMSFVIFELARVTKAGGYCVMVNDNVRYGGEEIPADLILSQIAESFGYSIEHIFVLPRGKGNSSQQMGVYGRTEVRKCVYLWRKK